MKVLEKLHVHSAEPEGFSPAVKVAAMYVEMENKILFLQRSALESEAGLWGVPGGKLERGETAEAAAKRELLEETGIPIDSNSRFAPLGKLFMRTPTIDYVFHLFRLTLSKKPAIILSREHQRSDWLAPDAIENYPLMQGALEAFAHYQNMSRKTDGKAHVNAYLILR